MKLPDVQTVSRQFAQLSRIRYGKRIHAQRDWLVLLTTALVLLLAASIWSAVLFFEEPKAAAVPEEGSTLPEVSEESLTKIEALFGARETERSRYEGQYQFVDPAR